MNHFRLISLLSILSIAFSYQATAQTKKGNFLVGGNFGFSIKKTESSTPSGVSERDEIAFTFNPSASYFLKDNLAVGLVIPLGYSKIDNVTSERTNRNYAIGPQVRYYFNFNKFSVFPLASYSIGRSITEGPTFDPVRGILVEEKLTRTAKRFNAGVGGAYFLKSNVAIEAILSYENFEFEAEDSNATSLEESGIDFTIGFQIYL